VLAGLSHLGLDILVGVSYLPLFWPISMKIYKLPFGLLPSAVAVNFTNPYFYRNLFIELGIFVPLSVLTVQPKWIDRSIKSRALFNGLLLVVIGIFIYWAYRLPH
jgi:inner membrane protein